MRRSLIVLLLLVLSSAAGAAQYEMTTYYVAFLHKGAKWTPEETAETARIQQGHMVFQGVPATRRSSFARMIRP